MNDMATASIIGRNTTGVGVPEVLSAATARTVIGVDASGTDNSTDVTLATVTGNYLSLSGQAITAGEVPVTLGGTGLATITSNGVMYGAGTSDVAATAEGATGTVLVGTTSGAPTWTASPTGLTIDCGTWAAPA
jgi:siroheme synthase